MGYYLRRDKNRTRKYIQEDGFPQATFKKAPNGNSKNIQDYASVLSGEIDLLVQDSYEISEETDLDGYVTSIIRRPANSR